MHAVFDLHCDTADRLAWQFLPAEHKAACGMSFYGPDDESDPAGCRSIRSNRCHISIDSIGKVPWAQCFACFIPDELSAEQSLDFYECVQAHLDRQIQENSSLIADVPHAKRVSSVISSGKVAAIRTIENARFFALDPVYAERAHRQGVAMASLSWNAAGPLASGHDTAEGLTPAGLAALRRMVDVGMAIDVSHLNDRCFTEVAAAANAPLVASHSNSRAICAHPRNLTDAQFDLIRERVGLVGLNFCTYFLRDDGAPDFDDISRHIDHWLERGGEDVIALGSDFDGCDTPACIETAAHMPDFQARLDARFGADITDKLCSGNALRFFSNL